MTSRVFLISMLSASLLLSISTMAFCCLLDLLPVELVQQLLSYFLAHEIFISLYNISAYLNAVIHSYPCVSVHFRSSVHSIVDWTSQRLQPEQIISLTIDNKEATRAQYELLFSCFALEDCTRLRSLTFVSDGVASINSILVNLNGLQQLRSLSILCPGNVSIDYNAFKLTASRLNRLVVSTLDDLPLEFFPNLRHLKVVQCSDKGLPRIYRQASQLRSLDITLPVSFGRDLHLLTDLVRLRLIIGE